MIRITFAAANQIEGLLSFYLYEVTPSRPEAAIATLNELAEARARIEMAPDRGKAFPATYQELRRYGFLWLRVRAYWMSWAPVSRGPIVTNVFHSTADIERHASPNTSNFQDWQTGA